MLKSTGFNFVADEYSKLLILGSMPGKKSLREVQYYAHSRNLFWDIMGILFDFSRGSSAYEERLEILKKNRIALWDVISACCRKGSLDADIDEGSIVFNDFKYFFDNFKNIRYVVFNGRKAESLFKKQILKSLSLTELNLRFILMPSTSPANASVKREDKIASWLKIKNLLDE
ncbi:MAG: DNA-deoxyinosine glycosylase [Victivallales bacterium]|nr:DNA-deoxyinosine glycosylase [Victivallales bacterium]